MNENNGITMYVIHRGLDDNASNRMVSDAHQVWADLNDNEAISMRGVFDTNLDLEPDAEILNQTKIKKIPTLLFVKIEEGIMTAILDRIEGGTTYSTIRSKMERLIKSDAQEPGAGQGGSKDDIIDLEGGAGGLGVGLGGLELPDLFNCSKYLPKWVCLLPYLVLVALIILLGVQVWKVAKQ